MGNKPESNLEPKETLPCLNSFCGVICRNHDASNGCHGSVRYWLGCLTSDVGKVRSSVSAQACWIPRPTSLSSVAQGPCSARHTSQHLPWGDWEGLAKVKSYRFGISFGCWVLSPVLRAKPALLCLSSFPQGVAQRGSLLPLLCHQW